MSTHEATSQQPLLQAIDLKKHYPVKKGMFAPERLVKALDGVSFTLERGKTLAVVGESGCGKSTLGRLLTMIETWESEEALQAHMASPHFTRLVPQIGALAIKETEMNVYRKVI